MAQPENILAALRAVDVPPFSLPLICRLRSLLFVRVRSLLHLYVWVCSPRVAANPAQVWPLPHKRCLSSPRAVPSAFRPSRPLPRRVLLVPATMSLLLHCVVRLRVVQLLLQLSSLPGRCFRRPLFLLAGPLCHSLFLAISSAKIPTVVTLPYQTTPHHNIAYSLC
ncbi:hypothetical protein SLA2020_283030 [Shorea laevis]